MSVFNLDQHIPIPTRRTSKRALPLLRGTKYPFYRMQHGDSFYVEGAGYPAIHSAAGKARQRMGGGFVIRPEGGGFRVWRVEH